MVRLRFLRLCAGIPAYALAKTACVDASDLSKIERGILSPYPAQLQRIADALAWERDPALLMEEVVDCGED